MTQNDKNYKRLFQRAAIVFSIVALILLLLLLFVNRQAVEDWKYTLSLANIIALVVIINLVSFLVGGALFFAYQWIKKGAYLSKD